MQVFVCPSVCPSPAVGVVTILEADFNTTGLAAQHSIDLRCCDMCCMGIYSMYMCMGFQPNATGRLCVFYPLTSCVFVSVVDLWAASTPLAA